VDELQSGTVTRTYSFGLERISETQTLNSVPATSFYGYDGHGSVRQLTNSAGAVTDTYDYDAFGNLVNQTGSTPNNYLFAGEQFDPAIDLYYNRARYFNTSTGRFWSMDTYEGNSQDPLSLHKYLYVAANPINQIDPSGNQIDDVVAALGAALTIASSALPQVLSVLNTIYLNLWQLPLIVDEVTQYAVVASGAIQIIHEASQALPELANNLLSSDQEYSAGPSPRGFQVETAAGANLSATNRAFDDFRYGELTQIKSTTQVQTQATLIANIRSAAQKLGSTKGPYNLNLRGGGTVVVQEQQVTSKNLLFVIPDEALTFTQQSLLPELQQIEQSEGIQIGVQAVQNLRGTP
jgi:RHS repeat-associated protein